MTHSFREICSAFFAKAPFRNQFHPRFVARPRRLILRSSLVYAASKEIPNRFQLCQTTSKAARKLHLSSNPTELTINRVLVDISQPERLAKD